jgi:hypothetical protein
MSDEHLLVPHRSTDRPEPIRSRYCHQAMEFVFRILFVVVVLGAVLGGLAYVLRRFLNLKVNAVDLGVLTMVVGVVVLPAREMNADAAMKGSIDDRLALALAEAKTIAHPDDPRAVEDLAHRLGELALKDWAIEAAVDGANRTKTSPIYWRAALAASVAYIERLDPKPALVWATKAWTACEKAGDAVCPAWEKTRMEIYKDHLTAGVDAGVDPRRDPAGFRRAGEGKIRASRIGGGHDKEQSPAPAPTPPPPAP